MNVSQPSIFPTQLLTQARQPLDRSIRPESASSTNETAARGRTSLWEILTPEEREFFAKQPSLTYRPGGEARETHPAPLGHQVDVRG